MSDAGTHSLMETCILLSSLYGGNAANGGHWKRGLQMLCRWSVYIQTVARDISF